MSSRRLPLVVAFCVLLVGVATVLAFAALPSHRRAAARATVPQELPGPSRMTAALATNPVGRALVLYRQGTGPMVGDLPRTVVVGDDGGTVRRLTTGTVTTRPPARAARPVPVSLSPDGRTVAVGTRRTTTGGSEVALVDVGTGQTREHVVPGAPGVVPLAWSPDSRRLAYVGADATTADPAGPLFVFDVGTRRATAVPGAGDVAAAAFSPDGSRLALQAPGADVLRVVDPATGAGDDLPVPAGETLSGGAAWSPDGQLIAVSDAGRRLDFVPTAPGRSAPPPVTGRGDVLGWLSGDVVVHEAATGGVSGGEPGLVRVERTDVRTSASSSFFAVPTGAGGYAVSDLSLATALLPRAVPVASVDVDRGPWPLPLRITLVVGAALLSLPATVGLRRRHEEFQRLSAVPEWARDPSRG
ncbi:WD40 repeat domain-containing protein [Kineococcus aurantiacus]|uniref:Dipeptidyl aminopeptidase/acylaminoacyl peptidase n=1 Tax=Kineococcus aurantiacus TaxID=37633 RepID=A0A7Y9J0K5_9ACTN|nr:hypothetical protein [Kineococcus aurantiacus]NYD22387.1 dipeptidyl aminopeptidase/acylaminoacyl peptidase [Kineococcus aurantiacus]